MNPHAISPMTPELAQEVLSWEYPGEYAAYNMTGSPDDLLDGNTYAVKDLNGFLVGFYQFGQEARIPAVEEEVYPAGPLDLGLGLRPDLCGLGLGEAFVAAQLKFARENLGASRFRLTVAAFNQRARTVYSRCGFFPVRNVTHAISGDRFIVMRTEELKYKSFVSVEDYCRLRAAVGLRALPLEQAKAGLGGSAYVAGCYDGERAVGSARILWDGGYTVYLADVMVLPEYQGLGIGTKLVEQCMVALRVQMKPEWRYQVHLLSAAGREGFYERFGFEPRPNDTGGSAMELWLE